MATDQQIWDSFAAIEQRVRGIELNLQRLMTNAQMDWVNPTAGGPDFSEALELLRAGNKIGAIKLVRGQTGMGLKEAQRVVDDLEGQI